MTPSRIKQVTDVDTGTDGMAIKFTIEAESGESLDLEFDKDALRQHIADLTDLALRAARKRTGGSPIPLDDQGTPHFDDLPVSQIGIGMTDKKNLVLILRLLDFDLTYRLEMAQVRSISNGLSEAVKALDADESAAH